MPKNSVQCFNEQVDFFISDDKWRHETQHGIHRAVDEKTFLETGGDDVLSVAIKFHADKQAFAPDVPDKGVFLFQDLKPLLKMQAELRSGWDDDVVLEQRLK